MNPEKQFCTFRVGDLVFGIDVMRVQEVIRYQEMTPVPLAQPEIAGLINLRGQIVTAIDMRRRLRLSDRQPDELPMNVVLTSEHGPLSLLVDEIGDVLDLEDASFEPTPETLDPWIESLMCGVYKLEGQLLLAIDADRAVDVVAKSDEPARV